MEGSRVSLAPGLPGHVRSLFFPAAFSIVLGASLLVAGCASTEPGDSLRGEIVDSRTSMGYAGEPRYYLTVECRETGVFSRLTFEVNQDDWMRFHSGGQEVCVSQRFGGFRLARCN